MKIRETKTEFVGRGADGPVTATLERVVEVEVAPEGAEVVKDNVPVSDWKEVSK